MKKASIVEEKASLVREATRKAVESVMGPIRKKNKEISSHLSNCFLDSRSEGRKLDCIATYLERAAILDDERAEQVLSTVIASQITILEATGPRNLDDRSG